MALSMCLTFFSISKNSLGIDEAFSLYVSRSWSQMISILWSQEANMWFYYFILHFWQNLGNSELVARSLSALCAVFTLPFVYLIGKQVYSKKVGVIASILTSVNLIFVYYAQTARSYSLSLLLVTMASYLFLKNESKQKSLGYIILSTLAIYSHFYTAAIIASHALIAIFQKNLKRYIAVYLTIALLLAPLAMSTSIRSHQVDWISKPALTSLAGTAFVLAGDFPPLFVIYGLLFLFLSPFILKNLKDRRISFLLAWIMFPITTIFLFSVFVKPLYQSPEFVIVLPPFMLLIAIALDKMKFAKLKIGLILVIAALSLMRLFLWYSENTNYKWVITNKIDDWKSATQYITANSQKGDIAIFYGYFGEEPYIHYEVSSSPQVVEISSGFFSEGGGQKLPEPNISAISGFKYQRIWLVLNRNEGDLFNRGKQYEEIKTSLLTHYSIAEEKEFFGVKVDLLSKNK